MKPGLLKVVLLTNDMNNKRKAKEEGLLAFTGFETLLIEIVD